jgi:hypothetical protein
MVCDPKLTSNCATGAIMSHNLKIFEVSVCFFSARSALVGRAVVLDLEFRQQFFLGLSDLEYRPICCQSEGTCVTCFPGVDLNCLAHLGHDVVCNLRSDFPFCFGV